MQKLVVLNVGGKRLMWLIMLIGYPGTYTVGGDIYEGAGERKGLVHFCPC